MKLIDLVDYLINEKVERLYIDENLNRTSEAILIYMKDVLNIQSELKFFDIERTDDNTMYENDGNLYIQLFPLEYAKDLYEHDLDLKGKEYSPIEVAKRLLEYRLRDA